MTILKGTDRQAQPGSLGDSQQSAGDDSISCEECGFEASVGSPTPVRHAGNALRETIEWSPRAQSLNDG